jgi:hypothetical protein
VKKARRHCHVCALLGPSQHEEPKSLPLAKPGVHRRKNEILKYKLQQKCVNGSNKSGKMTVTEVGGDGGKIVDFKVEPDELIDIEFSTKRTRLNDDSVQVKIEVEDDEDIQEVRLQPQSTEGHLTMPYPPPLASIATGQIVGTSGDFSQFYFKLT